MMSQENVTYFLSYNYTTLEASVRAQLSTTTCGATPTPPGAPDIPGSPPAFPTTTPFIREITPPPRSEAPNGKLPVERGTMTASGLTSFIVRRWCILPRCITCRLQCFYYDIVFIAPHCIAFVRIVLHCVVLNCRTFVLHISGTDCIV